MTNNSLITVNNSLEIPFIYAPAVVSISATSLKFWDLFSSQATTKLENIAAFTGTALVVYLHVAVIRGLMTALDKCDEHFKADKHGKAGLGVFLVAWFGFIECFFNFFGIQHFLQKVGLDTYGSFWWILGGALALVVSNACSKFFYGNGADKTDYPQPPARAPITLQEQTPKIPSFKDAPRQGDNVHQLLTQTMNEANSTARTTFSWTKEARNDLIRLLQDGLTRAEAALALGTTENSVDGACTRYRISKQALVA